MIIENLYYTKNHEWIRIEDGLAYVGITDYAQVAIGDIVFVELPEIGDTFSAGDAFAVVESVKAAADIYVPIGGTVSDVNLDLEDTPEQLNENPYENPIGVLKAYDLDELEKLMTADVYETYCATLED